MTVSLHPKWQEKKEKVSKQTFVIFTLKILQATLIRIESKSLVVLSVMNYSLALFYNVLNSYLYCYKCTMRERCKYDFATKTNLIFMEYYSKEMTKGNPDKGEYTIQKMI